MAATGPRNSDHRCPRDSGRAGGRPRTASPAPPSCSPSGPAVAAVDVRGGAPGSRETELLAPETLVDRIDAVVLSGGSAFGLDAASRCDGLARRGGPRVQDRTEAGRASDRGADRAGRDPVRPWFPGPAALDRRAAVIAALGRAAVTRGGQGFRAGQCRGRARRHGGPAQGRDRQRLAASRRRPDGRRDRRGQQLGRDGAARLRALLGRRSGARRRNRRRSRRSPRRRSIRKTIPAAAPLRPAPTRRSRWSPPMRRSTSAAAAASRSWRRTASPGRSARRTRRSTATPSLRYRPATVRQPRRSTC